MGRGKRLAGRSGDRPAGRVRNERTGEEQRRERTKVNVAPPQPARLGGEKGEEEEEEEERWWWWWWWCWTRAHQTGDGTQTGGRAEMPSKNCGW